MEKSVKKSVNARISENDHEQINILLAKLARVKMSNAMDSH